MQLKLLYYIKISLITLFICCNMVICTAQTWSQPVNITQDNYHDAKPDFCLDHNGVIHCVYEKIISNSPQTRFIYYRCSLNQGVSWSVPKKISYSSVNMAFLPQIVCDSYNNLYVAYKLQENGNYSGKIYFTIFNGQEWSIPEYVTPEFYDLFFEKLLIDNNDRIYLFFRYFNLESYYKYYENGIWSDTTMLYPDDPDRQFIFDVVADSENNLHCIGFESTPETTDTTKCTYYYYNSFLNQWDEPEIIGQYINSDSHWSIRVNSSDEPHLVWRDFYNNFPVHDATFYRAKINGQWLPLESVVEDPWLQRIDLVNDEPYIVESEKNGDLENIVFYSKSTNGVWVGNIIYTNYWCSPYSFMHDQDYFYIVSAQKNDEDDYLDVYFMRGLIDSIITNEPKIINIGTNKPALKQNYPNPFNHKTIISFELLEEGKTSLEILDISGRKVKSLIKNFLQPDKYQISWDGTDNNNCKMPSGVYYYRLITQQQTFTKSLILRN